MSDKKGFVRNVKTILNIQDDSLTPGIERPSTESTEQNKDKEKNIKQNIKQNETKSTQNNIQNSIQTKNNYEQNKKVAPKKHKRGAVDL